MTLPLEEETEEKVQKLATHEFCFCPTRKLHLYVRSFIFFTEMQRRYDINLGLIKSIFTCYSEKLRVLTSVLLQIWLERFIKGPLVKPNFWSPLRKAFRKGFTTIRN